MIWKQDGDPPHTYKSFIRCRRAKFAGLMARDIWHATAHEAADTVTMILSGNASTYGLGEYRSLWQKEEQNVEKQYHQYQSSEEIERIEKQTYVINECKRIRRSFTHLEERYMRLKSTNFYLNKKYLEKETKYLARRKEELHIRFEIVYKNVLQLKLEQRLDDINLQDLVNNLSKNKPLIEPKFDFNSKYQTDITYRLTRATNRLKAYREYVKSMPSYKNKDLKLLRDGAATHLKNLRASRQKLLDKHK